MKKAYLLIPLLTVAFPPKIASKVAKQSALSRIQVIELHRTPELNILTKLPDKTALTDSKFYSVQAVFNPSKRTWTLIY